jgi:tetratricopeptide (TPR) repeat protein
VIALKATAYMSQGDLDNAGRLLDALPLQLDNETILDTQIGYLIYRRNYKAAIAAIKAAMAAPNFVLAGWTSRYYWLLGWSQRWAGDKAAATATFLEGRRKLDALRATWTDNGYLSSSMALINAGLGDSAAALREAEASLVSNGKDQYARPQFVEHLAQTKALIGRKDDAIGMLATGLKSRDGTTDIGDLRYSPFWDSLRDDPRFQALLTAPAADSMGVAHE